MAYRDIATRAPGEPDLARAVAPSARAIIPAVQTRRDAQDAAADDLTREVYCLLGVPVDGVDMAAAVRRIEAAIAARRPFLLSTPNLNFLIASQHDAAFRESLLAS